jgi:CRISPR-associated exonuclease Cas4
MDDIIKISNINDFIFCPASIYFHNLYGNEEKPMFQSKYQLDGTKAHETVDKGKYSTSAGIITSLDVYSEKYRIVGKIDIYDGNKKLLIERKKHVSQIFDGYIFQLYAQYFCMTEMGYDISKLRIHSIDDNKNYPVHLPDEDEDMYKKFDDILNQMRCFDLEAFEQDNERKCSRCIYADACDRTLKEG